MNKRDEIEQSVYKCLCSCCPRAKQCHDDCVTCEEFDDVLSKALKKAGINDVS